jgi:hypothetical protein
MKKCVFEIFIYIRIRIRHVLDLVVVNRRIENRGMFKVIERKEFYNVYIMISFFCIFQQPMAFKLSAQNTQKPSTLAQRPDH